LFSYHTSILLLHHPAQSYLSPHSLRKLRYHPISYHSGLITAMARLLRKGRLGAVYRAQPGVDTALLVSYTRAAFP